MKIYRQIINKQISFKIIAFFILILLTLNCQSIEDKWKEAKQKNSIEAYQQFLKNNPNNKFETQAKFKIDSLRFTLVNDTNTIPSYERFLKSYPNSYFYKAAQDSIVSLKYKEILINPSIDSLRKFSKQYSEYLLANEADSLIVEMFNKQIQQARTYQQKDKIENKIIADILKNGLGNRFIIGELLPKNKNTITFCTDNQGNLKIKGKDEIESITIDAINSLVKTLYPKDKILFIPTTAGLEVSYPDSHCGIFRFIGKVNFSEHYSFIGKKTAPLTFMYLEGKGFVYLHGSGKVLKDNKVIKSF